MTQEKELYAVRYTFASYLETNPSESVVYIGAYSIDEARQMFGSELTEINKKYSMGFNYKAKDVSLVRSGTDKISLQSLEENVKS